MKKFKSKESDGKLFDEQINRFLIFSDIAQIESVEDKELDEFYIHDEFKEKLKSIFLSLKRKNQMN